MSNLVKYGTFGIGLLLSTSASYAQSGNLNEAVIDQIGYDNRAIFDQAGQRNLAGSDDVSILQEGIYNMLNIRQDGKDNSVGRTLPGIIQHGLRNDIDLFNSIIVQQLSDDNTIETILQESQGANVNGINDLSVTQEAGNRNWIGSISQIQEAGKAGQRAVILQSGADNTIERVVQYSNDSGVEGSNEIEFLIFGSNNGGQALEGFALRPSVQDSSIVQEADGTVDASVHGNQIDMTILGNRNQFGLRQGGRMNVIGPLIIEGDENQIGLRQDGTSNRIWMALVLGDRNEIGIDQIVSNDATVDLIGQSDGNQLYAFQQGDNTLAARVEGNNNTALSIQDYDAGAGFRNHAEIGFLGNQNFSDLEQLGSNVFILEIVGSLNNHASAGLFTAGRDLISTGNFRQKGASNSMSFEVRGDKNLVAATQAGSENSIFSEIRGNQNQMAFVQVGEANSAVSRQTGKNNLAEFFQ